MKERDMRRPVCLWLDSLGYTPFLECWSVRNCDIVGVKFTDRSIDDVVCVELKLKDIRGVLEQLDNHIYCSRLTYAAMPAEMSNKAARLCGSHGLLAVDGDRCWVHLEALEHLEDWKPTISLANCKRRKNIWRERLERPGMLRDQLPQIVSPA